jgi:hypothetical protein
VRYWDRVRSFVSDKDEWSSEFLRKEENGPSVHITVLNATTADAEIILDAKN